MGRARYERDPYAWSIEQARFLREGRYDEVDVENVADEILSVGRQELGHVEDALIALLTHMLIWDHRPEQRSTERESAIAEQRREIEARLNTSPSLNSCLGEAVEWSFGIARLQASAVLDVDPAHFPEACPYDWDAMMSRPFEPAASASR
jgi:hypothetical protein